MQLRALFTDERAVSQVVGVILIVAITVVLAATAASFFLGLTGDGTSSAPQAAITFEYGPSDTPRDTLEVAHESGDAIDASQLEVAIQDAAVPGDVVNPRFTWRELDVGSPDEVTAGMSVTVDRATVHPDPSKSYSKLSLKDATVRVVWESPSNSRTFVLNSWEQ